MKSNTYIMLQNFFNESLIDIAKDMNYSEENIIILEGDESLLKRKYPEIYENLLSCSHNRDFRTPIQYAQDLVCSWLYEDYLLKRLMQNGLEIRLSGEDRNRKLLKSTRVKANSDYLVEYNGKSVFVELANDYTGYWMRTLKCDLRDDKFLQIKNEIKNADYSLLLGVDFNNMKFFIVDVVNDENNITYSSYHYAFRKPAYSIDLRRVRFYDFTIENICNVIKNIIIK